MQTDTLFNKIKLAAGKYMIFSGQATEGNPVLAIWQQIWNYFELSGKECQRAWLTDYEVYYPDGKIEIFVGIA